MVLEIKNLVKDFSTGFLRRKTRVLADVTFAVDHGEIFGFVGPNGAGKTTTFKAILGLIPVSHGSIKLYDKDISDVTLKSSIGYLPESPYFYDYLTGEELLEYMGNLHGMNRDLIRERVDVLLEKVKMAHARKLQLRNYSKGMLQRIGIAQALINDPDFLILDEPMSGLDPIGRREIRDLILEQKKMGKTILISSHILADIESLCDRVGVIIDGRVVSTGVLADLLRGIQTDYEILIRCDKALLTDQLKKTVKSMDERAGYIVLRFDETDRDNVLKNILDIDAEIVSLYPLRRSLEGLFIEESRTN